MQNNLGVLRDFYAGLRTTDTEVSGLDPLHARFVFDRQFADLCKCKDALVGFVTAFMTKFSDDFFRGLNRNQAMAAKRDLAYFAGALTRWQVEISEVPALESALIICGELTDEVPSENMQGCSSRNPEDGTRLFTDLEGEKVFIKALRSGLDAVYTTLECLELLLYMKLSDAEYAVVANRATNAFKAMVESMVLVKITVPSAVFTKEIAIFLKKRRVGGIEYSSSGSQLPMILVDRLVRGFSDEHPDLPGYYNKSLAYQPADLRHHFAGIPLGRTILADVELACDLSSTLTVDGFVNVGNSIDALIGLMGQVLAFRAKHYGVVVDNFLFREGDVVAFEEQILRAEEQYGSGGHNLRDLRVLINETKAAGVCLRRAKDSLVA